MKGYSSNSKDESYFLYNPSHSCFHFFLLLSLLQFLCKNKFVEDFLSKFFFKKKKKLSFYVFLTHKFLFVFAKKTDPKRVRFKPRSRDIAFSSDEFRFQSGTKKSSKGYRPIRFGLKTRESGTPTSTSSMGKGSSHHQGSPSLIISSNLGGERLYQASEDDALSTLSIEDMSFVNDQ